MVCNVQYIDPCSCIYTVIQAQLFQVTPHIKHKTMVSRSVFFLVHGCCRSSVYIYILFDATHALVDMSVKFTDKGFLIFLIRILSVPQYLLQ